MPGIRQLKKSSQELPSANLPSSKVKVAGLFVDLSAQTLKTEDGQNRDIEPRAWELLTHFIRNPGVLLSKTDLRRDVWDGVVVSDAAISQAVLRIRAVLGDSSADPKFIETIHRRGYRLIAPLEFYSSAQFSEKISDVRHEWLSGSDLPDDGQALHPQQGSRAVAARADQAEEAEKADKASEVVRLPAASAGADFGARENVLMQMEAALPAVDLPARMSAQRESEVLPAGIYGRQDEMDQLKDAWASVLRGGCEYVFLQGDRGIGKSALIDAFADWLHAATPGKGWYLARVNCVDNTGREAAYQPVFRVLQNLYSHDPELIAVAQQYAQGWLKNLLTNQESLGEEPGRYSNAGLYRQAIDALNAIAKLRPLIIVMEDLQWADAASLALIDYIIQSRGVRGMLFLGSWRSAQKKQRDTLTPAATVDQSPLPDRFDGQFTERSLIAGVEEMTRRLLARRYCKLIRLQGISRLEVERIISAVEPELELQPQMVEFIWRWTGGNPLFVKALVSHLRGRGGADLSPQRLEEIALPAVLQDAVESNLLALGAAEREVLAAASIASESFSINMLQVMLTEDDGAGWQSDQIGYVCDLLIEKDIFKVVEHTGFEHGSGVSSQYRFANSLYRRVVYENLPRRKRRKLHLTLAHLLSEQSGVLDSNHADELAHHFERGGDTLRATQAQIQSGEIAFRRRAYSEALHHFQAALATSSLMPPSADRSRGELGLRVKIAFVYSFLSGRIEGELNMQAALAMVNNLDDSRESFKLLCYLYRVVFFEGIVLDAEPLVEKIRRLGQQFGDHLALMRAELAMAGHMFLKGQVETSASLVASGFEHFHDVTESEVLLDRNEPRKAGAGDPSARSWKSDILDASYGSPHSLGMRFGGLRILLSLFLQDTASAMEMSKGLYDSARSGNSEQAQAWALYLLLLVKFFAGSTAREQDGGQAGAEDELEMVRALKAVVSAEFVGLDVCLELYASSLSAEAKGFQVSRLEQAWMGYSRVKNSAMYPVGGVMAAEAALAAGAYDLGLEIVESALEHADATGVRWLDAEFLRLKAVLLSHAATDMADEVVPLLQQALTLSRSQRNKFWQQRINNTAAQLSVDL